MQVLVNHVSAPKVTVASDGLSSLWALSQCPAYQASSSNPRQEPGHASSGVLQQGEKSLTGLAHSWRSGFCTPPSCRHCVKRSTPSSFTFMSGVVAVLTRLFSTLLPSPLLSRTVWARSLHLDSFLSLLVLVVVPRHAAQESHFRFIGCTRLQGALVFQLSAHPLGTRPWSQSGKVVVVMEDRQLPPFMFPKQELVLSLQHLRRSGSRRLGVPRFSQRLGIHTVSS